MMKTTTYTITELKDLIGGAAFEKAIAWIRSETGIKNEEDAMIEADAYGCLFTKSGRPARG